MSHDGLSTAWAVAILLFGVYVAFWVWWGGNGKPMSASEREALLSELAPSSTDEHGIEALEGVRQLMANDDGKEFVMQNLVQYRPKALYPPGHAYSDDPRAADRRYGKAILWPLLKHGNLVMFIARRCGSFIEPAHADVWHYVAMVRYRSRRDFLKFAIDSNRADIFVHKWAAIQKTHVFPVKPIISLFFVRLMLALVLGGLGLVLVVTLR